MRCCWADQCPSMIHIEGILWLGWSILFILQQSTHCFYDIALAKCENVISLTQKKSHSGSGATVSTLIRRHDSVGRWCTTRFQTVWIIAKWANASEQSLQVRQLVGNHFTTRATALFDRSVFIGPLWLVGFYVQVYASTSVDVNAQSD